MFRTSSGYPLTQEEKEIIQNYYLDCLPKSASIRFGFGMDENLGTEVLDKTEHPHPENGYEFALTHP